MMMALLNSHQVLTNHKPMISVVVFPNGEGVLSKMSSSAFKREMFPML
jgi:hypothetical protein